MIAVLIPLVLLVLLTAISKLSVAKGYSITSGCGSGGSGGPVMARIVPSGNTLTYSTIYYQPCWISCMFGCIYQIVWHLLLTKLDFVRVKVNGILYMCRAASGFQAERNHV
jgi:hypothetical protein